jgi:predicted permease
MDALIKQQMVLYIFIVAGMILGKWRKDMADKSGLLSFLIANLLLPCKQFLSFSRNFTVDYLKTNYVTIFISLGILILLVLAGDGIGKLLTRDKYQRKVYKYSIAVANYAYFGYVLVESVLGEKAMNDMMVFCIPMALYCYTFGVGLLMDKKPSLKSAINPTTIAIILGIFFGLSGIRLPAVVTTVASNAGAAVGPVSMLLVGLVLSGFKFKQLIPSWGSWGFCLFRLLIIPGAVFGICKGLGLVMTLPASVYPSAVIMASMPCGLNPVIYPKLIGKDCSLGAKLIPMTAILSIFTIPLWMKIMGLM